jgi:hypothetical protein
MTSSSSIIPGMRFGKLVTQVVDRTRKGKLRWRCQCDCGAETIVQANHLKSGASKSCGCLARETTRARNLGRGPTVGLRFERLVVEREVEGLRCRDGKVVRRWECRCDCGRTVKLTTGQLSTGHTKSCGCLKREGSTRNKTYLEVGTRFGRLVVEGKAASVGKAKMRRGQWRCRCDCGEI